MKKISSENILLAAGILISFFAVIVLPRLYFFFDVNAFWQWGQVWGQSWQKIYTACPSCNYPFLGMFFSAGVFSLLSRLGFDGSVSVYRIFLSVIDGLNVLLVFWILKRLKAPRPATIAGVIGISFSSWVGGALWGQIDGISQFFILLTFTWVVTANTSDKPVSRVYPLYIVTGAIIFGCLILTKQLTIFSALSLALLLGADIAFHTRAWKAFLLNSALALAAFLGTLFVWDFFLVLKPPYFSHLVYIWTEGIYQNGIISGNGFNIWMLLGRDMWSSAFVPLFANFPLANPYRIGEMLFIIFAGVITASLLLSLKDHFFRMEVTLSREVLFNFILHLALINLCFNVFLSGTRERYLYHFYPYIIMAWAGLSVYSSIFSEKTLAVLILGAALYGGFVLQILASVVIGPGYTIYVIMAVFHLGLFLWLFYAELRYHQFLSNLSLFFRSLLSNWS